MGKIVSLLSLLALLACDTSDDPTARNTGLIGKWRLYESYMDPGDGSGKWRNVKGTDAEVIEFRADSTFRVVTQGRGGFFTGSPGPKFTVRANRLYLYQTQPEIKPFEGISFEVESERLKLHFPCDEGCGGKYVAIQ